MSEKHRKEIESLLNKSESGVNKRLQKLYKELAEETTQDIIKLAKEIEETDKFSKKLQKERLEAIRSQMYTKANQLEGTQKENIYDFLRHDGHVAFNELFYDFEMTEKIPLSFTMLTDKQINIIINTPVANRKLSTRLKGNSTKMKQNLNRVLTRGFAKGLSTQKMAVQIAEIGGANYRRAMNIARTESGRVTSVARQQSQNHAKEIGLKLEKQWISTLDKLTRHTHQILDGKTIDIAAYFEVSGHKALQPHMFGVASEDCNCRCRTITIVNGMGPELRKENESKEVGEYKNYEEWLANKTVPSESPVDQIKRKMTEINMINGNANDLIDLGGQVNEYFNITDLIGNKNQLKEVLNQFREMGGAVPDKTWYTRSNKEVKNQLQEAFSFYPKEWTDLFEVHNKKLFAGKTDRGFFHEQLVNSSGRRLLKNARLNEGLSIYASGRRETTPYHEIGHLVERLNPDILRISKEFLDNRTKGEDFTKLSEIFPGFSYKPNEVTKRDNFINPYIGKEYKDASEVLSMGLESLFVPGKGQLYEINADGDYVYRKLEDDPEYLNLIIGMLLKG